ncbi:tight adherence protein B [Natranaerovirga hydrolytica]|uniref:Tight adherence protein B n=1 Tax=Natranaerovirga hydrolytica TaxID=680378 RepID=A0A4V2Q201_9FIRM|nr:type II secretion system F family protein [Natranaerovirga hydrolytica]TCL00083.1 tight adherence protein B [Natranaerovirga hydrolytica]
MSQMKNTTNYDVYKMTHKEYALYYAMGIVAILMIGILFYNTLWIGIFFSPLSYFFVQYMKKELLKKQKEQLSIQFKDAVYSMSSALNVGYSVEMAFREALKDLKLIYLDPKTPIIKEFEVMIREIEMNIPVEKVIYAFAKRTKIEDIENFSDVFITCKRTGGDLIKIIKDTSKTIAEKIEVKREIQLIIAQKKFEQKIMSIIPFGIILYLWISSPGFLDVMYNALAGRIIMTFCLIVYLFAFILSSKIMEIEV